MIIVIPGLQGFLNPGKIRERRETGMKKKLAVGVLAAGLVIAGATAALGATDSAKLDEIKSLAAQMFGIQKQIVDKELDAGLITQQQADAMKQRIDQRQQAKDQAIANGQVFGPGMEMHGDFKFKSGQPWTDDQIKAWSDAMQARITAQAEAMKKNGTLTEDQIKAWTDAAQAQLEVQKEALKKGTFVPGGFGMPGGKGMHGGHRGGFWGSSPAPNSSAPANGASNT